MSFYAHGFEGELSEIVYPDKYRYFVVRLPGDVAAQPPFSAAPRTRVRGEIDGHPFDGAFLPDGDALPYLILSGELVQTLGLSIGDPVELRFDVEAADAVDVPLELTAALADIDGAREAFDALTPGRRRGLATRSEARNSKQRASEERRRSRRI